MAAMGIRPNQGTKGLTKIPSILKFILSFIFVFISLYLIISQLNPALSKVYDYTTNEAFRIYYEGHRKENRAAFCIIDTAGNSQNLTFKIANLSIKMANGYWLARDIKINNSTFFILPMTFLLSLIIVSPVRLKQKLIALLLGFVIIQLFIYMKFALTVLAYPEDKFALILLPSFIRSVVNLGADVFVHKMAAGSNLIMSVFIWLAVTFRRKDLTKFMSGFIEV